jgi:hypothetical protein
MGKRIPITHKNFKIGVDKILNPWYNTNTIQEKRSFNNAG